MQADQFQDYDIMFKHVNIIEIRFVASKIEHLNKYAIYTFWQNNKEERID